MPVFIRVLSQAILLIFTFGASTVLFSPVWMLKDSGIIFTTKDKVEILEFFWYGCPHCYHIEEPLNNRLKTKADYIEFKQVPAVFYQTHGWAIGAKAYYIADALDMLDTTHTSLFNAVHNSKPKQYDIIRSKKELGKPIVEYFSGKKAGKRKAWWLNKELS